MSVSPASPDDSLARANARLACDSRRIEALTATWLDAVERLVRAAEAGDLPALVRATDVLERNVASRADAKLTCQSRSVCELLRVDPSSAVASRRLQELLNSARELRRRRSTR